VNFTDYMFWKMVVIGVAALIYGIYRGYTDYGD